MGSRKSHRPRLETKDALAAPAKVGGRTIGKHRASGGASFVRPGDIARYVDAQKKMTSASSMLSKLNGDTTSRHLGSNVKFAPDVDVYPTGKNGKRVRPTYREDAKKRIHRRGDKGPTSSAATSTSAATAARDPGEQNDSQASKAFGSASQPVPMAPFPRQKRKAAKRLSQRKRKEPSRMKKRSLQFNVEASSSSGASSSATR